MRLDKFLKVSRIIKRRTVASDACDLNRITVNGKPAKPAKTLAIGDIIGVKFGDKEVRFKVLIVPEGNITKTDADSLYQAIEE